MAETNTLGAAVTRSTQGLFGRVLVVDDEPSLREFLTELLELADYEVVTAGDGLSGLARLEQGQFDLLLTDLVLPDMNGIEVVHRARRIRSDIAVIIVTGKGTLATAIQAIQEGAYDYIRKPFRSEELLERVKKAIERRRLELQNRQLVADLKRERELLQVRVDEATASLRQHLHELQQVHREQSTLYWLVTALRGKTLISEVLTTMTGHLRDVMPIGEVAYMVFDALGQTVAKNYPEEEGHGRQVGIALSDSLERLYKLFREGPTLCQRYKVTDLLVASGVPAENLDDVIVEPFAIGQVLYGVLCLFPSRDGSRFSSRHGQLLSLAMAQMTGVCEENMLLERGTQLLTMGEMISEIVHDLRSPLTAMRNNAKYLKDRYGEDEEAGRSLDDVLESATQMERLVGELLSFSKPEEMHLSHLVVGQVIDRALRMTRDYMRRKNIEITIDQPDEPVTATGNTHHLVEAIVNIIVNATQAMEDGGSLAIRVEPNMTVEHKVDGPVAAANQRFVRIAFADTGCGIAAKDLPKIFHRFYTTKSGGTGLGLSAVQRIVRQSLGYVAIESEVGVGTTIFVYLLH